MTKVILPQLGEGIVKAVISYWYVKEGDSVKEKEDLVELTTDKAAFNLPSPCTGVVREIFLRDGETVNTGDLLAVIEESS